MITYRKIQINGENSPCNGLWYARPVISEKAQSQWGLIVIIILTVASAVAGAFGIVVNRPPRTPAGTGRRALPESQPAT